jgi:hypothetical protein
MKLGSKDFYNPTNIFISIGKIQELYNNSHNELNQFIQLVSDYIAKNTGHAIELKLLTHPVVSDALMLYDRKCNSADTNVKPYSVPMGMNHPYGTVVHDNDFKLDAQIPAKLGYMSYVTTQNYNELKEGDITPFISYMYNAYNVERVNNVTDRVSSGMSNEQLTQLNKAYTEKYNQVITKLATATESYIKTPNQTTHDNLKDQLKSYVTLPAESLKQSSRISAPIVPISIEFSVDGINGFRYGGILTFDMLPERYKRNVVWQIINVSHKVNDTGKWTTTIKCAMKVDYNS